jgi:uncharacterized protein (TIGR03790 family)
MKHFIFITFTVFVFFNALEAQTNVNIPGPENVLVVYNTNLDVSDSVMQYYVNARGIPTSNIIPLTIPLKDTIEINNVIHPISIIQSGEIIQDDYATENDGGEESEYVATFHAWQYFLNHIAFPIKQHLESTIINGDTLMNRIRYIVLCKGIPFRMQPRGDYYNLPENRALETFLCFLKRYDYEQFLHNLWPFGLRSNPYKEVDPNFTMNYRFLPGKFNIGSDTLFYLVSRIDGVGLNNIQSMIDKAVNSDYSGEGMFVLDDDLSVGLYHSQFLFTKAKLNTYGFNWDYNDTDVWITQSVQRVMGYSSWGIHAEDNNPNFHDSDYIQTRLSFNYMNGAVFTSIESFNGNSITTLKRRAAHGLMTEFTLMGGTGGLCYAYEPGTGPGLFYNNVFFPAYAMGYNFIDAAYQSLSNLADVHVIIGDPLTTIAWGKQTLTSNLNWSGTNLVTGEIDISDLKTLTVANNSVINLRHQGFITGEGKLILGQNITFNLYSWQKGLFLSYDSDNPRLVWGAHPTLGSGVNYKVYRKFGVNGSWVLIATTSAKEYKDLQMQFSVIGDEADNLFYKVIAFSELPGTYESNIVACTGNKAPKKIKANQNLNSPVEYSLEQNYPNPFNPTTQINYSIRETGLVQLKIYDILGKEIATLVNANKEAGNYSVDFNAAELPSGVYIYKLQAGYFISSKKMILIK